MAKYVAVIESFAVRDVQYCMTEHLEEENDWMDDSGAEVYVGIFTGDDEEEIRQEAADIAETVPGNIRLIDVSSDACEPS